MTSTTKLFYFLMMTQVLINCGIVNYGSTSVRILDEIADENNANLTI
jgi:hypothetical protein